MVAIVGIIEIPKAVSKDTQEEIVVVEPTRYEEADSFVIDKFEIEPNGDSVGCYIVMRNDHVIFMAEITLEEYMLYKVGDTIPGTLIVEGEKMNFEFDEFGKSFKVLGYVGLAK